ncbi:CoA transferase [Micrococcus sp. ACRRV]|uniref:CoA transferase n=1 Tax=Micrococcus sp. ACRRV TaxID=2918203 RepID=UPI001EF1AA11|nr:CoA transferase [Micrococcus sp. ACRRV]MCG7421690.1 CoA transferase [Micrococcus sp. ACRRV]
MRVTPPLAGLAALTIALNLPRPGCRSWGPTSPRAPARRRPHGADEPVPLRGPARGAARGHPGPQDRRPRVYQVDVVGFAGERAGVPGHDLTYQAETGLLLSGESQTPTLPRALVADMPGAEQAVSTAPALLLARDRAGRDAPGGHARVSLAEAAAAVGIPSRHGLLAPRRPPRRRYPLLCRVPGGRGPRGRRRPRAPLLRHPARRAGPARRR